jgi:oxygen-independent coproporphyrinogen-3 oxidase
MPFAGPRFGALPPLSLYVHVPWCIRKCPYCDFNSHALRGELPERRYVEALTADLDAALPDIWGRRVRTVFFGGGTPSLLSPESVDAILGMVRARVPLDPDAEITLEANPGTAEAGRFAGFRAAGINRLSIGIQSFDPDRLRALGRIHDDREARAAIGFARGAFENFNVDLMYGLPGQSLDAALRDIDAGIAEGAPHVSAYHLTIEPNTLFHSRPPVLPDDDVCAEMQEAIEQRLAAAGYAHYETSAFAQPGRLCAHNRNYWQFGDYLGIGAGAHSKLSFPDKVVRLVRFKHPEEYATRATYGSAVLTRQAVPATDLPFEFMMNALRLAEGFPVERFAERTGLPLTAVLSGLAQAEARGFLTRDHRHVAPTPAGRRFLNDLLQIFLPDA